jgi:hypothetical protein
MERLVGAIPDQLQPRPVRALARHEPSGRRVEHELEHLLIRAAHLQTPAVVMHRQHHPVFDAPAEVQDPRPCADTG